jgi:excisionase family DNA binding protein
MSKSKKQSQTVIPSVVPPLILPRVDAAKVLGCTVSWLRIEAAKEHITPIRLGRRVCFSLQELKRYKSQLCQEAGDMAGVE